MPLVFQRPRPRCLRYLLWLYAFNYPRDFEVGELGTNLVRFLAVCIPPLLGGIGVLELDQNDTVRCVCHCNRYESDSAVLEPAAEIDAAVVLDRLLRLR